MLENAVKLFNFQKEGKHFSGLTLKDSIQTGYNPLGLCALSTEREYDVILVLPVDKQPQHRKQGIVKIYNLTDPNRNKEIECHEAVLQCFDLSRDGKRLVTVSQTGTLARVWDTTNQTGLDLIREFRRGVSPTKVLDVSFSNK